MKVKYSGLPVGAHTWLQTGKELAGAMMESPIERIDPGQVVDAGDLEDGTERSRLIKDHLARGVAEEVA